MFTYKTMFKSLIISGFLLLSTQANAQALGRVNGHNLNVRKAPEKNSEILATFNKDDEVQILDFEEEWLKIKFKNQSAYISSEFVNVVEINASVNQDNINIRKQPFENADVISQLNKGDQVTIISVSERWLKVKHLSGDAYIFADYADSNMFSFLPFENSNASDKQSYALVIPDGGLHLRKAASISSESLALLPKHELLYVLEKGSEWLLVEHTNGVRGYVHIEFVSLRNGNLPSRSTNRSAGKAQEIITSAKKYIGTPYRYGGVNLNKGVDCSGFIYSVHKNYGISLPRTSREMSKQGVAVSKANLQVGDLVFFDTSGPNNGAINHVGMYIGNLQFIHASSGKAKAVTISSLNEGFYQKAYVSARRVLK